MARTKKKRYQLLRNVVLGALVCNFIGMLIGGLTQATLVFMLSGFVSGTTIVVPVWGMLAIYTGVIAFIGLTYYIDRELENQYLQKLESRSKLPRRRYGH